MRLQSRKKIFEERVINAASLGVILHSASEGIFLKVYLLHDAIVSGPGFHFQIVTQPIDCLVMRAIHL